jgi:hypothetical protein
MSARTVNADPIFQGDHVDAVVTVRNRLNQPVTLPTGTVGTVVYGIHTSDKAKNFLVKKVIGDGVTVRAQTGSDVGLFDLVILPTDTENLAGDDLYHECVVSIGGKPRTIFSGLFPVKVSPIK